MREREYSSVARAYAGALFAATKRLGNAAAVAPQAAELVGTLEQSPKLLRFLQSPQLALEQRLALVEKVFGSRLDPVLLRLVALLTRRGRVGHLPEILLLLGELIDQAEGIFSASLASGQPLAEADKARLTQSLERYTGHKLRLEWAVEPALIGGIVFRFRDLLVDGSLRHGLEEMRRKMLGTAIETA